MKASVKNYRQSPRKVRLVADYVRGKNVEDAMIELAFLPKRASQAISKLIASAKANAEENFKTNATNLVVKEIRVDQGITMKRIRPRSRGMAHRINKRTSNILVILGTKEDTKSKKQTATKTPEKKVEKPVVKKSEKKKKVEKETKKTDTKPVAKAKSEKTTKKSDK